MSSKFLIEEMLSVGVIMSAFGTGGWCKVTSFSDHHDHLEKVKEVVVESAGTGKKYVVENFRSLGAKAAFKFAGVDSPEEAKKLTGAVIWIDRIFGRPLAAGEYYSDDLCKCRLFFKEEYVGEVTAVCENPAHDLLEIKDQNGKMILIPFIDHFIGLVDCKNRRIELKEDYILR